MKKRKGEIKNCIVCNKEFYVPSYRVEKAKFRSRECQNHGQYVDLIGSILRIKEYKMGLS